MYEFKDSIILEFLGKRSHASNPIKLELHATGLALDWRAWFIGATRLRTSTHPITPQLIDDHAHQVLQPALGWRESGVLGSWNGERSRG